jgi:hypothetical protein
MKLNKYTAALAAMGVISMVSVASAATSYVYITGSTAFRPAVYNTLNTSVFDAAPTVAAYKCSSIGTLDPHTAGLMNFSGNIGGQPYMIKCDWSGSEAGIQDLVAASGASKENFMADTIASGNYTTSPATTDSHTVDLAMADTDQSVSLEQSPVLTAYEVGIVPFVYVKNAQMPTGGGTAPADWSRLTNVTDPALRVALTGGTPLALFTGNPSDTKYVYIAGRDNLSGTFVNTMLDTQFGLVNDPSQIKIGGTAGAASNAGGLLSGKGAGVEGQSSGGTLSTTMTQTGSATATDFIAGGTGWYAIAYLGLYDADVCLGIQGGAPTTPAGEAVTLTYNGVTENAQNIENGTYSFWGNEWLFQSKNNLSTAGSTLYNILKGPGGTSSSVGIQGNLDGNHEISLTSMLAVKATSAADATHN